MRVGLIADTFSVEAGTGIARYNNEIYRGLISNGLDVKRICPKPINFPLGDVVKHIVKLPLRMAAEKKNLDLFHATSPVNALYFPVTKKPHVVTYHDLASILYRQGGPLHVTSTAPYLYRLGMHSNRIIAVSSQTKMELVKYLDFPEDKIVVINHGIDEQFIRLPRVSNGSFNIGYVGSMVTRKRIDFLIRAFSCLVNKYHGLNVQLSIYGKKAHEYPRLSELASNLKIDDRVIFHGSFSDEQLVQIYNSMDVFVMPSDTEGFGIPILEAQRCGVPVVVRNGASIPEEVTRCCLKADSEEDMANKLYELLNNRGLRDRTISKGIEYSTTFTWDKAVKETIKVYNDALNMHK